VQVQLQANALVTLEAFKDWFDLGEEETTRDDTLRLLINSASDEIERYCRRTIKRGAVVNEAHDGGSRAIYLRRPPIDLAQAITVSIYDGVFTTALGSDSFVVNAETGLLVLRSVVGLPAIYRPRYGDEGAFPEGDMNVLASYTGGYTTVPSSVQLACNIAVAGGYYETRRDPNVATESAGSSSKTVAAVAILPPRSRAILSSYVQPTVRRATGGAAAMGF